MIKILSTNITQLSAMTMLSFSAFAVQPMSESDLEIVSITTGNNILNIFGASQAGLKVENKTNSLNNSSIGTRIELEPENYAEGEATNPIALNELRTIEEDSVQNILQPQQALISNNSQRTVVNLNKSTQGNASVFSTNSEINYKTNNVNRDMQALDDGEIIVSRDLQIDLLKLENLRGDNREGNRSAGNIYLSDWNSRGYTRIISTQ